MHWLSFDINQLDYQRYKFRIKSYEITQYNSNFDILNNKIVTDGFYITTD